MADKFAGEVGKSLHQWKFGYRSDPTAKYATADAPGRADMLATKGGRSVYIEIKSAAAAFAFTDLRDNQRKWIEEQALKVEQTPVWIWLNLGQHPPNYNPDDYLPRRAFLVPYELFLDIENQVKPFQNSLPYRAGKGYNVQVQALKLDAVHLLSNYALQWNKGFWVVPENHPFYHFVSARPLWDKEGVLP